MAWAEGTGGTATAGTDYTALTGGTLTFAAGETRKTIDAAVAGDALDEADETVVVVLSGQVNATPGHGDGHGHDHGRRPDALSLDRFAGGG